MEIKVKKASLGKDLKSLKNKEKLISRQRRGNDSFCQKVILTAALYQWQIIETVPLVVSFLALRTSGMNCLLLGNKLTP